MNDVLTAIERHLHRKLNASELDYYQVIGLQPFCAEQEKIVEALATASESLTKSIPPGTSEASSVIVGKLIKQAQSVLLDPHKKVAYDKQLKKLMESKRSSNATPAPEPNADRLLPQGDPMLPYALALHSDSKSQVSAFELASATIPTVQVRRDELNELFPALLSMTQSQPNAKGTRPNTLAQNNTVPAWATHASSAMNSSVASVQNLQPAQVPGVSLVEQLRARRKNRNRMMVGGMLILSCSLLGFASFQFFRNRQLVAQQDKQNLKDKRSLPQVENSDAMNPGAQAGAVKPMIKPLGVGTSGGGSKNTGLPELPTVNRPGATGAMAGSKPEESEETSMPAMSAKPDPDASEPKMATPEPVKPEMTKETSEWSQGIIKARAALEKGDFGTFKTLIAPAVENAKTTAGKEKALRLDQLGQLYGIFIESFDEAKRKAKGTSSLKVGSAEVSIVESTAEKIIVRAGGKNNTYSWDDLPFGIAVAISDLGLDVNAPVDMAARAVYFSLHPNYRESVNSNEIASKRVATWFEKSQGKESVRADLKQALTDTYE
jgi:hypothetical protein